LDDIDTELAFLLACCNSAEQLDRLIVKHATIVQRLVCRMAREGHQTEDAVKALYASFAEMAVEQLKDQRQFPTKTLH
jgi:hypothetical protein